MKLTPLDIEHKRFRLALRGYRRREVREFLEDVALEREELLREVQILREQIERKDEQIERLHDAEAELRRAVVSAERIGAELKGSAKREAELLLREAERRRDDLLRAAEERVHDARREVRRLEREQVMFREQFRGLLRAYERTLDAPPEGDAPGGRAEGAREEDRAGGPRPPVPQD